MTIHIELSGTLPNLDAAFDSLNAEALGTAAFAIRDGMKAHAPTDTGAMQAAISVILPDESDYAENVAAARALNPNAEFADPPTATTGEAYVVAPAGYSGYVNYGTRHQPAQPFAEPAIEEAGPEIAAAMRDRAEATFQEWAPKGPTA